MAPLPSPLPASEQAAESAAAAEAHRCLPTPFLTKTYQLVDDPAVDDVISWNEDGSTFVVWRPAEFARDLLPKFFKHNNFSSFVRQLNTYGFRKIVPDRWEFANDCFRRGEKRLLCDIHRRKVQPAPSAVSPIPTAIPLAVPASRAASPTNSADDLVCLPNSPAGSAPSSSGQGSGGGASTELVEENHRLRKENERLNHELSQMKGLCNNIVLLMSKHTSQLQPQHGHEDGGGCSQAAEKPSPAPPPLNLMPLSRCLPEDRDDGTKTEEEKRCASPRPRLFGVHIGLKRARLVDDGDSSASAAAAAAADELPQLHRQAVEVKPEPADSTAADSPPDRDRTRHHHHRWRLYSPCRPNQRVCN